MSTPPVYVLPTPAELPLSDDPLAFLLDTLTYIVRTPCEVCRDADERRLVMYFDAAASLAATFPEDRQQVVWQHHCDKVMTCKSTPETATPEELRLAILALHGWARCRAANGLQNRGNGVWIDAALEALRRYRAEHDAPQPQPMAA
jgi:hypothetical protein